MMVSYNTPKMKRYKLISCSVFIREISWLISKIPDSIHPIFLDLGSHIDPGKLNGIIQHEIDNTDEGDFEAILLAYGLCGNSIHGLHSKTLPILVPKAHDCCTILLGGREAFSLHFGNNLSAEWSCNGYMESRKNHFHSSEEGTILGLDKNYEELYELYGEDNADYLSQIMGEQGYKGPLFYIDLPETNNKENISQFKETAARRGVEIRILEGNISLLKKLLEGHWDDDFIRIPPGFRISPSYNDEVLKIDEE